MTAIAVRERIDRLRNDGETFTPVMVMVDLLLDVRDPQLAEWQITFVDAALAKIARRHLLAAVEVQSMLDQIELVMREAETPSKVRRFSRRRDSLL